MAKFRRRFIVWWVDHALSDLLVLLCLPLMLLVPTPPSAVVQTFAAAGSGVTALLSAIVTFALGFLFQSNSGHVAKMRIKYSAQLRKSWRWCVAVVVVATLAELASILVAQASAVTALVITVAGILLALAATVRALSLFSATLNLMEYDQD